jgi:Ion channel
MLIVLLVALLCLVLCVGLHYQVFALLSTKLARVRAKERWRVMIGVAVALVAHLVEIGIFAAAMACLHQLPPEWNVGELKGAQVGFAPDYVYCSAMAYTTLGFEQITPTGSIRLLIGVEALVGLVLVAWSASFTYVQMGRYWTEHPGKE